MTFVVILHLSPHHESTLAKMFQRATAMPVVAARDGVTVESNSVYVIAPGKFLALANVHLRLTDAEEHRGKRVAADYFFRTLAETHGAQSLAGNMGIKVLDYSIMSNHLHCILRSRHDAVATFTDQDLRSMSNGGRRTEACGYTRGPRVIMLRAY